MGEVNGFTSPWDTYARLSGLRSVTLFLFPCDCGKSDLHQGADGSGGTIVYCKSCLTRAPLGAETSREREWHWNFARYARLEREHAAAQAELDLLGKETVECAQIVGEALAGPASLHIGHLPDMCRDLVAELTRLRAVEAAALYVLETQKTPRFTSALYKLAEACGRKG